MGIFCPCLSLTYMSHFERVIGCVEHRIVLDDCMSALEHQLHATEVSKRSPATFGIWPIEQLEAIAAMLLAHGPAASWCQIDRPEDVVGHLRRSNSILHLRDVASLRARSVRADGGRHCRAERRACVCRPGPSLRRSQPPDADASSRLRSVLDGDRALPGRPIETHVPTITKVTARAGRIFTMRSRSPVSIEASHMTAPGGSRRLSQCCQAVRAAGDMPKIRQDRRRHVVV
jgi:hypothetical protein